MELNIHREVAALQRMGAKQLRLRYAEVFGEQTPAHNKTWLVRRIAWRLQALAEGDLSERARRRAEELAHDADLRLNPPRPRPADAPPAATPAAVVPRRDPRLPPVGSVLVRQYRCETLQVRVLADGFEFEGTAYPSLERRGQGDHRQPLQWLPLLQNGRERGRPMSQANRATPRSTLPLVRCAIYTRKSTEEGLQQEFNSLDAQRESAEAYVRSQAGEGWTVLPDRYDDGGFSGGNMERPALKRLMADVEAGKVDCTIVYKVDRLSRSLLDFARILEAFETHQVAFVSVTQQINSATSMGRLMLNVLLSFAQFEREIIAERTRDKIAATRRKGKWSGGRPLLGYDLDPRGQRLCVNPEEAERVRAVFALFLDQGPCRRWRGSWRPEVGPTSVGGRVRGGNAAASCSPRSDCAAS